MVRRIKLHPKMNKVTDSGSICAIDTNDVLGSSFIRIMVGDALGLRNKYISHPIYSIPLIEK